METFLLNDIYIFFKQALLDFKNTSNLIDLQNFTYILCLSVQILQSIFVHCISIIHRIWQSCELLNLPNFDRSLSGSNLTIHILRTFSKSFCSKFEHKFIFLKMQCSSIFRVVFNTGSGWKIQGKIWFFAQTTKKQKNRKLV